MKAKLFIFLSVLFIGYGALSCTTVRVKSHPHKVKTIPPGQAKKITGSQSAKPYAPGQHKKR